MARSLQATFEPVARQMAQRYGVDPDVFARQMGLENAGWDEDVIYGRRLSPAGAIGAAQFMPGTAEEMGVNPYDPYSSLDGGARYMRRLLDMFDGDYRLALAAYNAGAGNVQKYGGVPPFAETQTYLRKILGAGGAQPVAYQPEQDAPVTTHDLVYRPGQDASTTQTLPYHVGQNEPEMVPLGQGQEAAPLLPGQDAQMTNQYAYNPASAYDVVAGSGIAELMAAILNQAAANQNNLYGMAGYVDPSALGWGNGSPMPTLAREQFDLARILGFGGLGLDRESLELQRMLGLAGLGLDREQLDLSRLFGTQDRALDAERFNFDQRLAEQNLWLQGLGLQAQQRGPENYLAYNYLLNNLGAPAGEQVDTRAWTEGLVQPYSAPPAPAPAAQAAPAPRRQAKPTAKPAPKAPKPKAPKRQAPARNFNPRNPVDMRDLHEQGSAMGLDLGSGQNIGSYAKTPQGLASLAEGMQAMGIGQPWPKMAQGGQTYAPLLVVGDNPSGMSGEHEEIVFNPTNAPLIVMPSKGRAAGLPHAAQGGMFGGTTYGSDAIAGQPWIQKLLGGGPLFGGNQLDTTLPGSDVDLGFGFNLANFADLMPSEQQQARGTFETPRNMGGLGLNFEDVLAASMRQAPVGRRAGATQWGL